MRELPSETGEGKRKRKVDYNMDLCNFIRCRRNATSIRLDLIAAFVRVATRRDYRR